MGDLPIKYIKYNSIPLYFNYLLLLLNVSKCSTFRQTRFDKAYGRFSSVNRIFLSLYFLHKQQRKIVIIYPASSPNTKDKLSSNQ
jgi:hypothetical protein